MQNFPILINNQVAVVRAQTSTGHILDENFEVFTGDNQTVYSVFKNLEEALQTIAEFRNKVNDVEFIVYNKTKQVIRYIN